MMKLTKHKQLQDFQESKKPKLNIIILLKSLMIVLVLITKTKYVKKNNWATLCLDGRTVKIKLILNKTRTYLIKNIKKLKYSQIIFSLN